MPLPAQTRAVSPSISRAADGHGPGAVAGRIDPPGGAGVAPAVEALVLGDPVHGLVTRPAGHRGRGMQGRHQLQHRGRRPRQASLHQRRQVLDIGHRHHGGLGLVVEVRAPRQQRVVDHVDGDLVLLAVLGRGEQRCRQPLVGGGVAAARGGAGHGMGADDVAGDRHQELGAGGHQACDRDDVAARIGRPQSLEHRQPVDGPVCGDVDLAGQHDLVQGAARDGLRGPLDQCAPVVGVALRADREPLHRCQRLEL